jgi:cytochrome c oxidase subunit 1
LSTIPRRLERVAATPPEAPPLGLLGYFTATDHKKIGVLTVTTSLILFFVYGGMAITMRVQLAQPNQALVPANMYDQLFTVHGSGMIFTVITPIALGLGVYMIPLQIGAPGIAAPRTVLLGYWLNVCGAIALLSGFFTGNGAAQDGWYSYTPLSSSVYTPGPGQSLWVVAGFLSVTGMMCMAVPILWTVLRMRAPGVTPLRLPVFCWSEIVSCLMVVAAFPSLLAAVGLVAYGRTNPAIFSNDIWDIAYQQLFWFYGHPVVYVMFFPFAGVVVESLATFAGRRYNSYKPTVIALLMFAALSMSVYGHHMFTTGQIANDYYSLTSICLIIPAGIEYFGYLGTIIGGRIRWTTSFLFSLGFVVQFLIGGLTGVMLGTTVLDYDFHGTYFVVGHFHYTLFGGSVFGLMAGIYLWFPKVTGYLLDERLGKVHFWLMALGTNTAFMPMLILGFTGLPRRVSTYAPGYGFGTLSAISTAGAFLIGISMAVFVVNVIRSLVRKVPGGPDPWGGHSLEWATSSPPPRYNFVAVPPVHSYAPLLDLRLEAEKEGDKQGSPA